MRKSKHTNRKISNKMWGLKNGKCHQFINRWGRLGETHQWYVQFVKGCLINGVPKPRYVLGDIFSGDTFLMSHAQLVREYEPVTETRYRLKSKKVDVTDPQYAHIDRI